MKAKVNSISLRVGTFPHGSMDKHWCLFRIVSVERQHFDLATRIDLLNLKPGSIAPFSLILGIRMSL